MKRIRTIKYAPYHLLALTAMLAFTACSDDDGQPTARGTRHEVTLAVGAQDYQDDGIGVTRTIPTGFKPYDELYPHASSSNANILAFITPQEGNNVLSRLFALQQKDTPTPSEPPYLWTTNVSVEDDGKPHYIYGFMPISDNTSDDVSVAKLEGAESFADGATITIRKLNTVTSGDVCVIVGAKAAPDESTPISAPTTDVRQGQFAYTFSQEKKDYIYLLLDHIYVGLRFQIKVDDDYNELRTIKLKKMELEAMNADGTRFANTADVTITLKANDSGATPIERVTYSSNTSETAKRATLDDATDMVLSSEYQDIMSCFSPASPLSFHLITHYEVYDKKGNLIRENCQAENNFQPNIPAYELKRGIRHTVQIVVNPTYLYVLSEPDLDSPTFHVGD